MAGTKKAYLLSLFLVGIPSIYLGTPLLNTLNLAKVIWIILFLIAAFNAFKGRSTLIPRTGTFIAFILFFFAQSFSILGAQNINSFLNIYKDVIFISIFFVISTQHIQAKKDIQKIAIILISLVGINLALQLFIVFDPILFVKLASAIFHPTYAESILANIGRGRIFLTTYDESILPIIFYFTLLNKPVKNSFLFILMSIAITVFSVATGFRTKIIMSVASLISICFTFKRKAYFLLVAIFLSVFAAFILIPAVSSLNVQAGIERITESFEGNEDISTGRITLWEKAYEMGLSSPVYGVGLGNYYDHLSYSLQKNMSGNKVFDINHKLAIQNPHNIFVSLFAETGLLGVATFIALLILFIRDDIRIFKENIEIGKPFVLSFWTLFIFSLLNPYSSIFYLALFWLFRAIIINCFNIKNDKRRKI